MPTVGGQFPRKGDLSVRVKEAGWREAQLLRELVVHPEELVLIPCTHTMAHNHL